MARLTFHGAAETVTGSKYLLETGRSKVLIDCGMFQGLKELRERNWQRLPFNPAHVHAVVLTHAHIDHSGYLPRFVKDGFRRRGVFHVRRPSRCANYCCWMRLTIRRKRPNTPIAKGSQSTSPRCLCSTPAT